MAHSIHRYSAIARPVEPKYPTNLAVLVIMGVALVGLTVAGLVRGASLGVAALGGLVGSLVVFTTWALGRDLAPDDDPAAFVALVPVAAAVLVGINPQLLEPLLVLGLVRVVNRSVGPPATLLDRTVLITLVLVVARDGHGIGAGLAAVLAFGLDAVLPERHPHGWIYAAAAAVAAAVGTAIAPVDIVLDAPGPWTWSAIACAGLLLVVVVTQPVPRSRCDGRPHTPLRRDRVRAGMVVALVAAAGSLLGGDPAVQAGSVLWAAFIGVVLTRPWHLRAVARSSSTDIVAPSRP